MPEEEVQRVLVIQDASRDVSPGAIRAALQGFALKPGDVVTILGVLHHVTNPSTFSFIRAGRLLGYKIMVDKTNNKIVQEELDRRQKEYLNNEEIMEIGEHCKTEKIEFHIEVHAGACPKRVALMAAKKWEATWVILDRQMKQYKKYFMEMLSCGMSSMKRNNSIQLLRAPQAIGNSKVSNGSSTMGLVTYNEMVPGSPDEEQSTNKSTSDQKTSLDKGQFSDGCQPCGHWTSTSVSKSSPSEELMSTGVSTLGNSEASSSALTGVKCSPLQFQEEGNTTNTEQETAGEQSPLSTAKNQDIGLKEAFNAGSKMEEEYSESLCSICKNRRPKIEWKRDFTYLDLQSATEGFAKKNFISEGGFGSVYRGEVDGLKIAVKQHKNASFQGDKEFKAEVHVLSKVRHKNLVRLLGSCSEGSRRLLVYEYVCNGSLDQHLSRHSRKPLSWEKRIRIALGAAKGLQYLHENKFIHRDMRPNNILITHDYEALLGDFGLARPQNEDPEKSSETRVVGTLGYLAPEYAECGIVSTKTDVYAFGVVLLQLITGMRTTDKRLKGRSLVGWARPLLKEKNYPDLIDERIMDSHDVHQLFWMVRMAEKCLSRDPNARLTMDKVVEALDYLMECNPICGRDCSPAQSDSVSSMPGSGESQCSMPGSPESPCEDGSYNRESTSMSHMSQMSVTLSSSPPPATFSSSNRYVSSAYEMSTLGGKKREECETEVSQKKSGLLYDEMVT